MDRNSTRTSVVIEVANQDEPEDQKTYQIDFDDLDIPKDYVIDKVFCGENITVFALFEVPEDGKETTDDQLVDVSSPKTAEEYRFFHKNPSKKIASQKKFNGFKEPEPEESAAKLLPSKENRTESFYCLKHLSKEYDMLNPEKETSDLKILFAKNSLINNSRSTKFKAISKGVNTDIVQSPKIIQEVEKAVKQNIPFSKADKTTLSSDKSSYEVIEMEMRQSFSSLSSHGDSRKSSKKSFPNFFLVPLLMMDDGVLSHFESNDKIQSLGEKRVHKEPPDKISRSTNTDFAESSKPDKMNEDTIVKPTLKSLKSEAGSDDSLNLIQKRSNSNSRTKTSSSKLMILSEIKEFQKKLNAFIKSIESTEFSFDESDDEKAEADNLVGEPATEKLDTSETFLSELKSNNGNKWDKWDNVPILPSLTYPVRQKFDGKKKQTVSSTDEKSSDISISMDFACEPASKPQCVGTNNRSSEKKLKAVISKFKIDWSQVGCQRGARLSKSAATLTKQPDPKFSFVSGIKKSMSYDLKDVKLLEVSSVKKIKNISFKLDGKPNIRIPQKGETNLKCEKGDEAFDTQENSKIDALSFSKVTEKEQNLQFDKIKSDSQKNLKDEEGDTKSINSEKNLKDEELDVKSVYSQRNVKDDEGDAKSVNSQKNVKDEEGDAKSVYSKKNVLPQMLGRRPENVGVHYCHSITQASENLLTTERSLLLNSVKSKPTCYSVDAEFKVLSDSDKPTTPNRFLKKGNALISNIRREVGTVKRLTPQINKNKVGDKPPKAEGNWIGQNIVTKQKSVTGSKKFTLKGNPESKLHVDRLMKSENLSNSKTASAEKASIKSDRTFRLSSQRREPTHDVLATGSKEKTEKLSKTVSVTLVKKKDFKESTEAILGKSGEHLEGKSEGNPPSGVVVELLDEKPKFSPEKNQPWTTLKNGSLSPTPVKENPEANEKDEKDSLDSEKPVVKSLWALTKVLLFEDGTKKIEILEASLTPPKFALPEVTPE